MEEIQEQQQGWLVMGTTGEYSGVKIWPVRFFDAKSDAEDFCEQLNAKLISLGYHESNYEPVFTDEAYQRMQSAAETMKAFDPNAKVDFYAHYEVAPVLRNKAVQ